MAYFRRGQPRQPLIVFLPGGCHLARIAYGYGDVDRRHFIDHWFEELGCGFLGLGYPTDHPSVNGTRSDLTIADWAEYVADVVASKAREEQACDVLVLMWSMAGRSAFALNRACVARGVGAFFLSLAATPPLPGLIPVSDGGEPLGETGFWTFQGNKFMEGFIVAISKQSERAGRQIVGIEDYKSHYLCNTPIMLRGTAQRFRGGRSIWSGDEAAADMLAGETQAAPLTGTIVPTDPSDLAHALGDAASWGHVNTQWLIRRSAVEERPSPKKWAALRDMTARRWHSLTTHVDGGHFFFVGEPGARKTANASLRLLDEMKNIQRDIDALLTAHPAARVE